MATYFRVLVLVATAHVAGCGDAAERADTAVLRIQVLETERAFARTFAQRDLPAFTAFVADEAIFFSGETPVRGKQAVTRQWRPLFEDSIAPFSWDPDNVEVLESGSLALSSGPVRDPGGTEVGRFNSVWRRESSGDWRVVFDKGSPVCACEEPIQ